MTTTPQQQPKYYVTQGTQHTYIEDNEGNYLAKTFDTSAKNHQRLRALVAAANSVAGLSDPAAALQAAREALEWTLEQAEAWLGNYTGGPGEDEYREQLQQARAALQQLRGEAQP